MWVAMTDATRTAIAEALENLAAQASWNPEVWQRCHELVTANWENELVGYVHDDLIHYDGNFHSHNLLGFRVKPDIHQLEDYRHEFRAIAAALRANLSSAAAKEQFGL
jgi:hypothetical protein